MVIQSHHKINNHNHNLNKIVIIKLFKVIKILVPVYNLKIIKINRFFILYTDY